MAVRREKVILELDDQLSSGMVRAAASSALLDKALDRSSASVTQFGRDSDAAGKEIDRLSGRMRIFADIAAILGPTINPLGAALVTPLVGLTSQLGFAAIAGGTAMLAFNGVGDALKAMNEYGLDPSQANAEKLAEKLGTLDGSTQKFVQTLHDLGPEIDKLQAGAARGLFPGFTEGLDHLETRLPEVQGIIATVSSTLGDLLAEAGENLASDEWDEWFATVQHEATPALNDMGHSLGNIVAGLAEMWQAFMPLSRDFSSGLLDMSRDFHAWADSLDESQGFHDFLEYVRESGPQAASALGAIGNMLVQILQAAAPLGGPILRAVEAFADAVAVIADSDLGTPIFAGLAALAVYNRAMGLATLATKSFTSSRLTMGAAQRAGLTTMRADARQFMAFGAMTREEITAQQAAGLRLRGTFLKTGAAAAGLGLAMSPLPEQIGLSNTAMLAMTGMIAGPWGAAVGGGIGLLMDWSANNKKVAQAERETTDVIKSGSQERIAARLNELRAQQQADRDSLASNARRMASRLLPTVGMGLDNLLGSDEEAANKTAGQIDKLNKAQREVADRAREANLELSRAYGSKIPNAAMLSTAELEQKVAELREGAHRTSTAFVGLGRSLDDSKVSLNGWIRDLQKQATALRDFRVNAQTAAKKGLRDGLIAELQAAGPEGALRMKQLANATQTQIRKANHAWVSGQVEIKKYDDAVAGVPTSHGTTLNVYTGKAYWEITRIQNAVRALRDRTITVTVNTAGRQMGGVPMRADGGEVPGQRWPYADKTLILAAPGEEVITNRNGEADRFRADRAAGRIPAYADGGTIPAFASGGTFTRAEYSRAARNFDLNAGQSAAEAARELRSFAAEVRRAGGKVGKNFDMLSKRVVTVSKSLDRQQAALESLQSRQADARSGAAAAFNNNAFGGTLADMVLQLQADRNDANSLANLTASLRGKGATTDFLASIASSGNLGLMRELASASRSQVLSYQSLFGQRATAQAAAGNQAAAAYTAQIKQQTALIKRQTAVIERQEKTIERAISRSISNNKKASTAKGKGK